MSKKDKKEEMFKSLVSELGLSEDEQKDLRSKLFKSDSEEDEKEDSAEDKVEDKKEEKKEEKKEDEKMDKSEKTAEEDGSYEKSDKQDLLKSLSKNVKKLTKAINKSQNSDILKSLVSKIESLEANLDLVKSQSDDIYKSVDAIGSNSLGTKGMRFNNYLEKGGDKPYTSKDGKTVIASTDRAAISEAMLSTIEKSQDEDLAKSMGVDLINYQGSGQLSERAIANLNKAGYIFREQVRE
jgi:molecular chaperone GrpE (heat shock protein)